MSNKTPQGLKRPSAVTTTLSNKPIILVGLLVMVIIGLLVISIFDDGSRNTTQEDEIALIKPSGQTATTTDEEGLNLPRVPETRGVINIPSAPGTVQEPIMVLPSPEVDPLEEIRRQEKQRIRQYKFEKRLAALESKPVSYRKNETAIKKQDQVVPALSPRLAQLQKELALAQAEALDDSTPATATVDRSDINWSNGHDLEDAKPFSILTGSIIPVVLITGIESTLPGEIIGQVSLPVYDTATRKHLLIPQGTKVIGQYRNEVAMGQDRLYVIFTRLIFPDGRTMTLSNMPGGDLLGYSGLKDEVDNHYFRIYGHALLMSLITGASSYAIDTLDDKNSDDESTTVAESMGTALANQMGQTTMKLLERHMSISPTLKIRPGYRLNVIVVKDLEFKAPYKRQRGNYAYRK